MSTRRPRRAAARRPALRARDLLWGAVVVAAPIVLVLLTLATVDMTERALTEQADRRARVTAALVARLVSERTQRLIAVVEQAGASLEGVRPTDQGRLTAADRRIVHRTLAGLRVAEGVEFAAVVDPTARLVALVPSDPSVLGRRFDDRDWYRGVRRRSPYISRVFRGAALDRPRVSAVAARIGPSRRPAGYVVATQGRRLQALVDALAADQGVDVTVTDQRQVIVARSGDRTQALVPSSDRDLPRSLTAISTGRLRAYAPVGRTGWVTTAAVTRREAYAGLAPVRAIIVGFAILGGATLAVLVAALLRLRARRSQHALHEQLTRSLLPRLPEDDEHLRCRWLYQPGEQRVLLGGDFMDAIRLDDGTVSVIVGDVCGHGPAAVGLANAVRHAWRTLKLAAIEGPELAQTLDRTVAEEVGEDGRFVTAVMIRFPPDASCAFVVSAGHPAPLLLDTGAAAPIDIAYGPAFGVSPGSATWTETRVALADGWAVLAFTDGLVEGRVVGQEDERYGVTRLARSVPLRRAVQGDGAALSAVLLEAEKANGGPLADDVAMVLVSSGTPSA